MKNEPIKNLVSFDEITELAINMPGCKALMHYVNKEGKTFEVPLENVKKITVSSPDTESIGDDVATIEGGDSDILIRGRFEKGGV